MSQPLSRRRVARAAAWSAPAVLAASQAPAASASVVPVNPPALTSRTQFSHANTSGLTVSPYSCAGKDQVQVNSQYSTSFFTISNLVNGTAITNISTTFWLPVAAGTTFSPVGSSSACWSTPTATGQTVIQNGVTYRAYTTVFSCSATATSNGYTMPYEQRFNFVSSCQPTSSIPSSTYHYTQTATVTGGTGVVTVVKDNGWSNVMS